VVVSRAQTAPSARVAQLAARFLGSLDEEDALGLAEPHAGLGDRVGKARTGKLGQFNGAADEPIPGSSREVVRNIEPRAGRF